MCGIKKLTAAVLSILIFVTCFQPQKSFAATNYYQYSNKKISWELQENNDHVAPIGDPARKSYVSSKWLRNRGAYYVARPKKTDKVCYLTFDCGYENGYTRKFLDTLKKYKVKATFFVTNNFIKEAPGLVKRMKKEGHMVGNHTTYHRSMPTQSLSSIKTDLRRVESTMKSKTGYKLDPFMRPPMGEFSSRTLRYTKSLGYTSILWSLYYYDWEPRQQPSKAFVVKQFRKNHHNGMIPLIHCVSKANAAALPDVIEYLKSKGYRFGSLKELVSTK